MLFADDAAIAAHSQLQTLQTRFAEACKLFALTISLKKTKVIGRAFLSLQSSPSTITGWSYRRLTLIGKITVKKRLLASQLVYILSPLASNFKYIKSIQNDFYSFLWNGKGDKIKRSEIINDYVDGGLKMLDLTSFSKSEN